MDLLCAHRRKKHNETPKKNEKNMAVHLRYTQFSYMCVQQEMPMKKEEEAWLLGKSLPLSFGSCGVENKFAGLRSDRADCTGKPSKNPAGDKKQQSRGSKGEERLRL